jgi:1,4-dihydroxy-2-naphthoate octaprenyltransferase
LNQQNEATPWYRDTNGPDSGDNEPNTGRRSIRPAVERRKHMLYTILAILLILWLLGMVTSYTAGGLLHLLLVVAVIIVIFRLISGRRIA